MLENHILELENLCEWYIKVKEVLLIAESKNKDKQIYIQPYNELRYCLDHLMRAFVWEFVKEQAENDKNSDEIDSSVKHAINSSIGHLQRAYSDICEWYCLNVKQWCEDIIEPFSIDQITRAIPDYYSKIKPRLIKLEDELVVYKENKSSEKNNLKNSEEEIIMYDNQFKELSEILETVQAAESSLVELAKKDRRLIAIKDIIIPLFTAVISGILVYVVTNA